jgi:hypothetical protein
MIVPVNEGGTMKQVVAVLVGSLLIAGAVVFHGYQRRYEGSSVGGVLVRLDSRTGRLSPCVLMGSGTNVDTETILQTVSAKLRAAGFGDKEVGDWVTGHYGQMVCSPWSD